MFTEQIQRNRNTWRELVRVIQLEELISPSIQGDFSYISLTDPDDIKTLSTIYKAPMLRLGIVHKIVWNRYSNLGRSTGLHYFLLRYLGVTTDEEIYELTYGSEDE
jgi:hypothetical protein